MLVDSTGLKVFGEGEWNCGFMELLYLNHTGFREIRPNDMKFFRYGLHQFFSALLHK